MEYVELQVTTNFTFLLGASHPEEMVAHALQLGYGKIAITDRNTLAGVVRAHAAAKGKPIAIIPGCRLDLLDGTSLLAYPTDKAAYARLSGLLTLGNLRAEKGQCHIYKKDVFEHAQGIKFIVVAPDYLDSSFNFAPDFISDVSEYRSALGDNLYLATFRSYDGDDAKRLFRLKELSDRFRLPMAAVNDVHYHCRQRRQLQDILTCIREKCTIDTAGFKLYKNAERYLKPIAEMHRLFLQYPQAVAASVAIAEACTFSLSELTYVYPRELTAEGRSPMEELAMLVWKGATDRFGSHIPEKIVASIEMELGFIQRRDYASYFLTVHDFVSFARKRDILCQGRGSAANSVVCYCLGITSVDPSKFKLLFARFMSDARNEPPDIDVDFEHERREEVMQYIYNKYGRDRAGIVATVTQVHWRTAVRDVGKAMGLSHDAVSQLAKSGYEFDDEWMSGNKKTSGGFSAQDAYLRKVIELTRQYISFPRQLGQHTGGFVITQDKLSDLCPILNARMKDRTNIEWNKDDIETLGFLKVDVLALGMLTCIRKAFQLARQHYSIELDMAKINEKDDPKVYEMICHADTMGVFQIESRAQMSMLPRLKPKCFYDLVIEVAIVRPGPIQGDMVHPYLRRREGKDPVEYPSKELEAILGRTLGVPLFQEQAMEIAIVAAGFTPTEADGLRRSMATFKFKGLVSDYEKKLVEGMIAKGYSEEFARRVFRQLEGFGSYGFPESHAASFALLVYVSCWIKCYYPDVFTAALLNSMPMGFYQPAQLVTDAKKHGVQVRPIDINHSLWDNTLEERSGNFRALRLGFRQIIGIREQEIELLTSGRKDSYRSITQLLDAGLSMATLEKLADADAFRSIGLDRRQALWEVSALADAPVGMFHGQPSETSLEAKIALPVMSDAEHVVQDFASHALSLKAHPVSFVRQRLLMLKITALNDLDKYADGAFLKVAGLVLVRQRPETASGVCFITIEDETGFANLVVFGKVFDKYRREILQSRLLMVEGRLQREGEVTHVVVRRCVDLSNVLAQMTATVKGQEALQTPARADEKTGDKFQQPFRHPNAVAAQLEMFPSGRNFK